MTEPDAAFTVNEFAYLQIENLNSPRANDCALVLRVAGLPDSLHLFRGTERECHDARRRVRAMGSVVPVAVAAMQLVKAIRQRLAEQPEPAESPPGLFASGSDLPPAPSQPLLSDT